MDKADIKALAAQDGIDISTKTMDGLHGWYTGLAKIYDAVATETPATLSYEECVAIGWAVQGLLNEARP